MGSEGGRRGHVGADLRFCRPRRTRTHNPRIKRGNDALVTSLSRRQKSGFEGILARQLTLFDATSHHD